MSVFVIKQADEVLAVVDAMIEKINENGYVTVSDFNNFIGVTGTYLDQRIGWLWVSKDFIKKTNLGYIIDLPTPTPIF